MSQRTETGSWSRTGSSGPRLGLRRWPLIGHVWVPSEDCWSLSLISTTTLPAPTRRPSVLTVPSIILSLMHTTLTTHTADLLTCARAKHQLSMPSSEILARQNMLCQWNTSFLADKKENRRLFIVCMMIKLISVVML